MRITASDALREVVPVRVSRRQKVALRRLARQSGVDVSCLVRDMIEERCRRESSGCGPSGPGSGAPAGSAPDAADRSAALAGVGSSLMDVAA